MFELVSSLLAIFLIGLSTFGVGRLVLRRIAIEQSDPIATVVWSHAFGLLSLGWLFAGLGFAGWLTAPVVGVISLIASLWGLGEITCWTLAWRYAKAVRRYTSPRKQESIEPPFVSHVKPSTGLRRLLTVVVSCVLTATLLSALSPPLSDQNRCGSLELAKDFLLCGRIEATPLEPLAAGPLLDEMWYVWALALDGPVAAGLFHWWSGILLALATAQLAALVIGRGWMWIAASVLLITPGVIWQMSAPQSELTAALFATLAIVAWWRAALEVCSKRWFWMCGLMLGGAMGCNAVAIVLLPTLGLVWLGMYLRHVEQREQLLDGWLEFLTAILGAASFWYIRCWWLGGNAIATVEHAANVEQLGPLLLAALPAVAVCRKLRGFSVLLSITALAALTCLAVCPLSQWWSLLAPLLAVVAVWVAMEISRFPRLPRYVTQIAWSLLVVTLAADQLRTVPGHAAVALGWQQRDDYLRERQASYGAAMVANRLVHPGARVLSQDPHGLYFGCPITDESLYRSQTSYHLQFSEPAAVSRCLRAAGFSHVLLVDDADKDSVVNSPLNRMIDAQLADPSNSGVLQLTDYRFTGADRAPRRYRLLMLR